MIRFYIATLLLLLSAPTQGQVTLTSADVGAIGTKFFMQIDTNGGAGLDLLTAGTNRSWDFTSLLPGLTDTIEFLDPATTGYGADFPTANLSIYQADLNGYAFLNSNSNSLEIIGFAGDPANLGATFILPQTDPLQVATFPFTYQDNFSDLSIVDGSFGFTAFPPADSGRIKSHADRALQADAWGELALPGAVYNVLRVKEITTTSDSIWIHIPFLGWNLFSDTTYTDSTFSWWGNGLGYILCEIAYSGGDISRITYQNPNQVSAAPIQTGIHSIFPNPAGERLHIRQDAPKPIQAQIYNLQGQLLRSKRQDGREVEVELEGLPEGAYMLRIMDKAGTPLHSEPFLIRR